MKNLEIFEESKVYMPGGVNSPVRAFKDVAVNPPVIKKGEGVFLFDEDDNQFIDFVCSWGPMILGHCDEDVVAAIATEAKVGISFGAPTKLELDLAKFICTTVDQVDMIRMVNSGTEATMSAVKLARGFTERDKIIKFAGCYHGHFDGFLVSAGSGVMTEGIPGCAGVPVDSIRNTLIAQYNNLASVKEIFEKYDQDIAAVIIEPIAGNMGVIPAKKAFLKGVKTLCEEYGSLLIFDEVMSGFRVAYKGAQSLYPVKADLITFAKIMGGGLPCGAYGGRKEIMEFLSPLGPVYQAGTMSGNPIVMAAGWTTLNKLYDHPEYYEKMEYLGDRLEKGVKKIAAEKHASLVFNRCGSMFTIFFTKLKKVCNYEDAKTCDTAMYAKFFKHMLRGGIYLPPSQFESIFISVKHEEIHIDQFLERMSSFKF